MPSTTIPSVKAAVVEVLEGAEALSAVKITTDKEPEPGRVNEWIWVPRGKAKREHRVLGPQPAKQDEDVEILMRVVAVRRTHEAALERVEELVEAVENALRADPTLSNKVFWQHIREVELEPLNFDTKVGYHGLLTLSGRARI